MASNGDAAPSGAGGLPAGPHFLESEWVIWEHRAPDKNAKSYEDNMAKLCEVATIEDFWRAWNNIPPPSSIFFDGRVHKKFANRTVEAFSLFKKDIKPEWEDAANRAGAEWFCRKQFPLQNLVSPTLRGPAEFPFAQSPQSSGHRLPCVQACSLCTCAAALSCRTSTGSTLCLA
jgi:hypothetical protein